MTDLHIHRTHRLGLPRARELAWAWAERAEAELGLTCTYEEGDQEDTVRFARSGVQGQLRVTPAEFDLHARLGWMLGALAATLQAQAEQALDAVLAAAGGPEGQRPR